MEPLTILIAILTLIVTAIIGIIGLRYQKRGIHLQEKMNNDPSKIETDEKEEMLEIKKITPLLITCENLTDSKLNDFSVLIKGSFKLLEADRLVGSWGKTIVKYMELTQDEGKWTDDEVFKYYLTGSLTHTYHALNGLSEYYKLTNTFFDPNVSSDILYYIKIWRRDFGAFATPVTNFDGSWGNPRHMDGQDADLFRREIPQLMRHTSCGILAINRLLDLRDISRKSYNLNKKEIHKWEEIVDVLNNYNVRALQVLSAYSGLIEIGDPNIWGKVRYTPAYVILAINEGLKRFSKTLSEEDNTNLQRIRTNLIEFAFNNALESDERFFCQHSNKKAFYYYTLLFLENYMNVEQFMADSRSELFCRKLIQSLSDVLNTTNGLSFGNIDIPNKPWISYRDIGITSRYLCILNKYSKSFEVDIELVKAFNKSLSFILDNVFDFEYSTRNFLTHGWESILKLISIIDNPLKISLMKILSDSMFEKSKEFNLFIETIKQRDFQGRESTDQQSKLIELLSSNPTFSKVIQEQMQENDDNLLHDYQFLKTQIELYFTRETFISFLEKHKIPFREDANLEKLIDTTLYQFHFKLTN